VSLSEKAQDVDDLWQNLTDA